MTRSLQVLVMLSIIAISFLTYHAVLHYPFLAWDDPVYAVDDPAIQQLTFDNLVTIWSTAQNGVWYPLARLSHAIDIALFGKNPFFHHGVNILLHGINGFLVFLLARQLLRLRQQDPDTRAVQLACYCASVLFVLHPQHLEVVVWITQRNELLATFGFLLCGMYYCNYLLHNKRRDYWLAVLASGFAMCAKPTAVGIPFVLLALDLWLLLQQDKRQSVQQALVRKLPFLISALAICTVSISTHLAKHAFPLQDLYSLPQRIAYGAHNLFDFLYRFLVPLHLTPIVQFPLYIRHNTVWMYVPIAGWILLLATLAVYGTRGRTAMLLLLACIALTLPACGILMFGFYSAGDRYMYMPSAMLIALVPLVLLALFTCCSRMWRITAAIIALPLLVLSGHSMHTQLQAWHDDISLWQYVIPLQPQAGYPRVYLAEQMARHNLLTPAQTADAFEEAIRIEPVYEAITGLINVSYVLGDRERLQHAHEQLIRQYPNHSAASKVSLGILLLQQHDARARNLVIEGVQEEPDLCGKLAAELASMHQQGVTGLADELQQILQAPEIPKGCGGNR